MTTEPGRTPRLGIAVLAAGLGERFGGQKLIAQWRGKPLLLHVLEAAQGAFAGRVHLITGFDADAVSAAAGGRADFVHFNDRYREGIGTSIAMAARAGRDNYDAMVVALADQPLVSATRLDKLVAAGTDHENQIIATRFRDVLAPPVVFGKRFFGELRDLRGDSGAKSVINAHPEAVITVGLEAAAVDIDTPSDLAALDKR